MKKDQPEIQQVARLPPVVRRGMRRASNKQVSFRQIKSLKDLESDEDLELSIYSNFPDREY